MKKYLSLLMCILALVSCGKNVADEEKANVAETTVVISPKETTNVREDEVISCDIIDTTFYNSIEELKEAYSAAQGYSADEKDVDFPYALAYDENKYEPDKIYAEPNNYHHYSFKDKETGKYVTIGISYATYLTGIEQYFEENPNAEPYTIETEKESFNVALLKTPYIPEENYGVLYIPKEHFEVTIYADYSTKEEIIEYFDDFEIEPA